MNTLIVLLELGVEEGLDGGAGELEHQLDENDEDDQFEPPGGCDEALTQFVPHMARHKMQGIDNGQHDAPSRATRQKDGQIGPLKVGEDAADDLSRGMERVGAEENPQECHETERYQPRDDTGE